MERIKYINNRELLAEIDRCKQSYTVSLLPQYQRFDAIVHDITHLTPDFLQATLTRRIEIVTKQGPAVWGNALELGIGIEDLVFRVMTKEHIPIDPTRKRRLKSTGDEVQTRTPFPPYKHYIIKDGLLIEVVRSHWRGDFDTGAFDLLQGQISRRLAMMFMLLVERYSKRGNWRGYCCDETTEALTQRGWLGIDQINETDIILSYDQGQLKWSRIKSIFRDDYDGKMFRLTAPGLDALVTPSHKFVTTHGLKEVEYLVDGDKIVLTEKLSVDVEEIDFHGGRKIDAPNEPSIDYQGKVWCPETEFGCFMARRNNCVYITGNTYNDEMRSHALLQLSQIGLQFDESKSDNPFAFYTTIIKNCLAGETSILTREYGAVPIAEVSEQDVTLLDGNGDWVKCHIYDHGIQETQLTYFQGGNHRIGIWSTLDHGWISDGKTVHTREFLGKNTKIDDLRPSKTVISDEIYRKGIIHGLIYGDGSKINTVRNAFSFSLCSHYDSLFSYMSGYTSCMSGKYPRYYIGKAWANFKAFPENPGNDLDYLLGFLRGWFAADGCVSTVPTPTLCGDPAEFEWLKTWGPLVGWHVNAYTKLAEETNFGKRQKESCNFHLRKSSMDAEDFLVEQHRRRWMERPVTRKGNSQGKKYDWAAIEQMRERGLSWKTIAEHLDTKTTKLLPGYTQYKKARDFKDSPEREWHVYSSREQTYERRTERVYCPVVETTHSFALAVGIQSKNCFTRVLNVERKAQHIRDDLLIIAGVQPSYTRQIDHEIEQRFGDEHNPPGGAAPATGKVVELPKKRGRKPKGARPAEPEPDHG